MVREVKYQIAAKCASTFDGGAECAAKDDESAQTFTKNLTYVINKHDRLEAKDG